MKPANACTVLTVLTMTVGCGGKTEVTCDDSEFFDDDVVLQIELSMDVDDWDNLRSQTRSVEGELSGDCRAEPFKGDYTYFPATLTIDGDEIDNIGIRKKGFIGSQSSEKPSFRINLDEYVDDNEYACTDNITLNNSVQDPALLRQCLSYKVFRDAGIPAPRCNFARVTMNGTELGIYVNVEPVKKKFLRENFGDDEGDLYEGTITDFTHAWNTTFDPKTDETDSALGPIKALADDLESSDDDLESILRRHFDLDQLLTYLAVEVWVGHWDGYGGNQNNFFVYREPDSDRMQFIPWGTDGTMDPEQIGEEPWFPNSGYLVQQILAHDDLANRWFDRIGDIRGRGWDPETLLSEVDRLSELLGMETGPAEEQLDALRYYIAGREDSIRSLLPFRDEAEFGNPVCMIEHGFIEADFSTEWSDTPAEDIPTVMDAGTADLYVTWDGMDIAFDETGAFAGPVEDGYGNVVLAGGFTGENGPAYLLPVFYFEMDALRDDTEVGLDWGAGTLLFMDETTGWQPVEIAEFWGSTATLDEASPVNGAAITGSFSTGIYTWQEVEG